MDSHIRQSSQAQVHCAVCSGETWEGVVGWRTTKELATPYSALQVFSIRLVETQRSPATPCGRRV